MNKKVLLQVGCFLIMFALEMIAACFDPASTACSIFLILSLLMIPVFVAVGRLSEDSFQSHPQMAEALS